MKSNGRRHFHVAFDNLVTGTCLLFSFLAGWCCDYHDFERVSTQRWWKARKHFLYQVLHCYFFIPNIRALGVLVFYGVAKLPIEKVCIIKNFEEANFRDFKRLVWAWKLTHRSIIGLKRLVKSSTIHLQAQTGVLLWCRLSRAKFKIRYESLNFGCFWPDLEP